MDPVRGVLMVIVVVFSHVSKSCVSKSFKKELQGCSRTVRIWVKQGFKVSNKMMSTVVTFNLFKVHVNPFTGPMVVKGRSKRKIKTITNFI